MSRLRFPWAWWLLPLVVGGVGAGCGRTDPLAEKVAAGSALEYAMWRRDVTSDLSPAQWKDFDAGLQEIKQQVMADREASGSEAVDQAMRAKIHGHTVREAFLLGYDAETKRLQAERATIDEFLQQNAELKTRPGDDASAAYLAKLRQKQADRRDAIDRELTAVRARREALAAPAAPPK